MLCSNLLPPHCGILLSLSKMEGQIPRPSAPLDERDTDASSYNSSTESSTSTLRYPFTPDYLPLDYSQERAQNLQSKLKERDPAWLAEKNIRVHISSISKDRAGNAELVESNHCFSDEAECRLFLNVRALCSTHDTS